MQHSFILWVLVGLVFGPTVADAQYRVRSGDTLSSIAARNQVTVEQIQALNPRLTDPDRITPGLRLRLRAPAPRTYRVRAGDTLSSIAREHEVALPALIAANQTRVPKPELLSVGAQLVLPGAGTTDPPLIFEHLVDARFADRVRQIAGRLRMDPDHLMAVMHYETGGTFSPSIRNPHSRAVGLIQFLPSTARRLGTTDRRLARMNRIEQLEWVEKYLRPYRGRMDSIEDAYMAVFTPAALGRGNRHVLYRRPQRTYRRNRGHDRNGDGRITYREVGTNARLRYAQGVTLRERH